VANPAKIERELGWKARTGFEEGFGCFVEWLKSDGKRREFYRSSDLR
jgi:nucleoside-diphosphate-sugar epimerase